MKTPPIDEWIAGAGLGLRHHLPGARRSGFDRRSIFRLDTAHRVDDASSRIGRLLETGRLASSCPGGSSPSKRRETWRTPSRRSFVRLGGLRPLCCSSLSAERQLVRDELPAPPVNPESTRRVRLDRESHNVLRMGPGDDFAVTAVVPEGSNFEVIAKSGNWYNVRVSESQTAWVHSSLCHEYDDLSALEFRPNPRLFSRIGSFTVTGYGGGYSFDRKSNSLLLGGRLGYYIFDFVNVEGGVSWTHVTRPAEIVESLFDLTLEAEDFHMLFYEMNANVEMLPGRQLVPYATAELAPASCAEKPRPVGTSAREFSAS